MFIVEKKNGKRKAHPLERYMNVSSDAKNFTVLDKKGKKIIKNIDKETLMLKFG